MWPVEKTIKGNAPPFIYLFYHKMFGLFNKKKYFSCTVALFRKWTGSSSSLVEFLEKLSTFCVRRLLFWNSIKITFYCLWFVLGEQKKIGRIPFLCYFNTIFIINMEIACCKQGIRSCSGVISSRGMSNSWLIELGGANVCCDHHVSVFTGLSLSSV